MHKFIVFLSLTLLFKVSVAQDTTVSYREIVSYFYSNYDTKEPFAAQVQFEKENNDWYVRPYVLVDGRGKPSAERQLLYDSRMRRFERLSFGKPDTTRIFNPNDYIDEFTESEFALHPSYGYEGWYNDVIELYEKRKNLTEGELYSLARAYNSRSVAPIADQRREAPGNEVFHFGWGNNAWSAEQQASFLRDANREIELLKQLSERNPSFMTRVGDIRLKYSNEVMFRYHTMLSFAKHSTIDMKLPDGLYPDSVINWTIAVLEDCPRSAVFLSFGDNDLYPFLYAQAHLGIRQDVFLVNYNLLAIDKYIYLTQLPHLEARPLAMDADTGMYAGLRNEFLILSPDKSTHSIDELLHELEKHEGVEPLEWSASAIVLDSAKISGIPMVIDLSEAGYLLRNHWIILDILNSLDGRPLAMLYDFPDQLADLNRFLKQRGSVMVLEFR